MFVDDAVRLVLTENIKKETCQDDVSWKKSIQDRYSFLMLT